MQYSSDLQPIDFASAPLAQNPMLVAVCHIMLALRFPCFNKIVHKIIVDMPMINVRTNAAKKIHTLHFPFVFPNIQLA